MPKSKKKPTKKALKQKQKQLQQQIVNVNIGRALREAVRRRSRPLGNVAPIQQPSIFRVNEPTPSYFQPFTTTQAAIKIPEPEPAQRVAFNIPEIKREPIEIKREPIRETPFTRYVPPEKTMSDTEFEYDPQFNLPIRNVRENIPPVYGEPPRGGGGMPDLRIQRDVPRIWEKAADGSFILKEGVPIPEGKVFNRETGRFKDIFKNRSSRKKTNN